MTNGANYTWGKLYQSPWQSDIGTPNQLSILPGQLSCPFQTNNMKYRWREGNQWWWIISNQMCPIDLLAGGISDDISISASDTIADNISVRISMTMSVTVSVTICIHIKAYSEAIPNSNP